MMSVTRNNSHDVTMQIIVAALVSENAYKSWDDNPILTTVSTTAFPIHSLEYPAITICGQVTSYYYTLALFC